MSVYQVEQYYIYTTGMKLSDSQKDEIKEMLSDHGISEYEFQDGGQIVVDGFEGEDDAQEIEDKIYEIAGV